MTESAETPPHSGSLPPQPRTRGWVKIVLAVSLAMNLAVAGLAAGAWMRHGGRPEAGGRDLGLGPIGDAMTREDRKAMRDAFVGRVPAMRGGADTLRADFDALIAALRQVPLDPVALRGAMEVIAARTVDRLRNGQEVVGDYLATMSDADRAAFADRLEKTLARGKGRPGAE